MNMDEYQAMARRTAVYPDAGLGTLPSKSYCVLGLAGEAGEVANAFKKLLRGDVPFPDGEFKAKLLDELGDVLWYAAMLSTELGENLSSVAARNIGKLAHRAQTGGLKGSGNR